MLRPAALLSALALACADGPDALAPPDATVADVPSADAPPAPREDAVADVPPRTDVPPPSRWPLRLGGPGDDALAGLTVTPSGDLIVAITFRDAIDVGPMLHRSAGGADVLLARLGTDGAVRWTLRLGGAGDEQAAAVASVGDDLLVALDVSGRSDLAGAALESAGSSDVAVARFSADGRLRRVVRLGGAGDDHAAGVAALGEGAVVAFSFGSTVFVGGLGLTSVDAHDVALAAFAADGSLRWARRFGGAGDDAIAGVATDGDAVYAAGTFEGLSDYGGPLFRSEGARDVWVASLNGAGGYRWSRRFGGRGDDRATSVAARGGVTVAGSFEGLADYGGALLTSGGGRDGFVAALGNDGAHRWSRRLGSDGDDEALALAMDTTGDVAAAGAARGLCDLGGRLHTNRGGSDAFVVRFAPDGAHRRDESWGGAGDDAARSLVWRDGAPWMGGSFTGEADVGGALLRAGGGADAVLAPALR